MEQLDWSVSERCAFLEHVRFLSSARLETSDCETASVKAVTASERAGEGTITQTNVWNVDCTND